MVGFGFLATEQKALFECLAIVYVSVPALAGIIALAVTIAFLSVPTQLNKIVHGFICRGSNSSSLQCALKFYGARTDIT